MINTLINWLQGYREVPVQALKPGYIIRLGFMHWDVQTAWVRPDGMVNLSLYGLDSTYTPDTKFLVLRKSIK